jgi:secreted trypsin-like serine protease
VRTRWTTTVVLALVGVLLGLGAVAAGPASAVANGSLAARGSYPYAVRLTMRDIPRPDGTRYSSACSGALVSPTWVVTAGHCFHDAQRVRVSGRTPYPTTATLRTVDVTRDPGESRTVDVVRQSAKNDIALAHLTRPVTDVRPLALAGSAPTTGRLLTLAGWGATSSGATAPSKQLRTGVVAISAVRTYSVYVVGRSPRSDTSACPWDSGAPYVQTSSSAAPRLVAVESGGPDCPHTSPETTSRVDTVLPWIRSVVTDLP